MKAFRAREANHPRPSSSLPGFTFLVEQVFTCAPPLLTFPRLFGQSSLGSCLSDWEFFLTTLYPFPLSLLPALALTAIATGALRPPHTSDSRRPKILNNTIFLCPGSSCTCWPWHSSPLHCSNLWLITLGTSSDAGNIHSTCHKLLFSNTYPLPLLQSGTTKSNHCPPILHESPATGHWAGYNAWGPTIRPNMLSIILDLALLNRIIGPSPGSAYIFLSFTSLPIAYTAVFLPRLLTVTICLYLLIDTCTFSLDIPSPPPLLLCQLFYFIFQHCVLSLSTLATATFRSTFFEIHPSSFWANNLAGSLLRSHSKVLPLGRS
jgi:hypothetical protein